MQEYPKSLYPRGWDDLAAERVVASREEEDEARAGGFAMLSEAPLPHHEADVDGDSETTVKELRDAADSKGIAYDGRWGAKRLREALEVGK